MFILCLTKLKEVEKIVPPALKIMENEEGLTPKELFDREHTDLYEKAIIELNGSANTYIVVATLVVTLGITGALTIRTNDNSEKTPIFKQEIWYMIFLLSVGFGVSLCAISMLLFTSIILPSTWRPTGDYVSSHLTRLTFGFLFLYSSVGIMGIYSVISGGILVYTFLPNWVFYVIVAVIGIAVVLSFVFFYRSLYYFALPVVLTFCQQYAARILSTMGINYAWDHFYFD